MHHIKLQQPPRHRQRVWDVARELGVSSRQLLEVLKELDEYVPSAASYLEAPIIRTVHDRFGVVYDISPPAPHEPEAPTLTGLLPPKERPRRENHPLMEAGRSRDDVSNDGHQGGQSRARAERRQAQWSERSLEEQWAQASTSDAAPAFEFEEWKFRGFTEIEQDVWMDAGLRAGQAKWAGELRDSGLKPADLRINLHGWTIIDRLRQGEGAAAVARLLREYRESRAG
jgi:hypothetical protein